MLPSVTAEGTRRVKQQIVTGLERLGATREGFQHGPAHCASLGTQIRQRHGPGQGRDATHQGAADLPLVSQGPGAEGDQIAVNQHGIHESRMVGHEQDGPVVLPRTHGFQAFHAHTVAQGQQPAQQGGQNVQNPPAAITPLFRAGRGRRAARQTDAARAMPPRIMCPVEGVKNSRPQYTALARRMPENTRQLSVPSTRPFSSGAGRT